MTQEGIKQIDIKQILQQKAPSVARKIPAFVINYLIRTIHQEELNEIIRRFHDKQGVAFMQELIRYFDLHLELMNENYIPKEGQYIFASNHPLGGMDGICLSAIIGNHFNGNIRYLVNDLLLYIPNLKDIFVPINKHGAQEKKNALLIEEAYASKNQIITFPAGLCSRKQEGKIMDLEWKKSFIQKAIEHQKRTVTVVPFPGELST